MVDRDEPIELDEALNSIVGATVCPVTHAACLATLLRVASGASLAAAASWSVDAVQAVANNMALYISVSVDGDDAVFLVEGVRGCEITNASLASMLAPWSDAISVVDFVAFAWEHLSRALQMTIVWGTAGSTRVPFGREVSAAIERAWHSATAGPASWKISLVEPTAATTAAVGDSDVSRAIICNFETWSVCPAPPEVIGASEPLYRSITGVLRGVTSGAMGLLRRTGPAADLGDELGGGEKLKSTVIQWEANDVDAYRALSPVLAIKMESLVWAALQTSGCTVKLAVDATTTVSFTRRTPTDRVFDSIILSRTGGNQPDVRLYRYTTTGTVSDTTSRWVLLRARDPRLTTMLIRFTLSASASSHDPVYDVLRGAISDPSTLASFMLHLPLDSHPDIIRGLVKNFAVPEDCVMPPRDSSVDAAPRLVLHAPARQRRVELCPWSAALLQVAAQCCLLSDYDASRLATTRLFFDGEWRDVDCRSWTLHCDSGWGWIIAVPSETRKQNTGDVIANHVLGLPCVFLEVGGLLLRLPPCCATRTRLPYSFLATQDTPLGKARVVRLGSSFATDRVIAAVARFTEVSLSIALQRHPAQHAIDELDHYASIYAFLGVSVNALVAYARNMVMLQPLPDS